MKNLTIDTFKTEIFDFENNEEWKYLDIIPCIIDFSASWCNPCKQLHPILEDLSVEYEGKINIYNVDVDEQQDLSALFHIKSVPSILFIPMGGQPQMLTGGIGKDKFKTLIKDVLKVE